MARTFAPIPLETERVATDVIGSAIDVHRVLGPGFLERIYETERPDYGSDFS